MSKKRKNKNNLMRLSSDPVIALNQQILYINDLVRQDPWCFSSDDIDTYKSKREAILFFKKASNRMKRMLKINHEPEPVAVV